MHTFSYLPFQTFGDYMDRTLILLFNHTLTPEQEMDARRNLGISRILEPPDDLRESWANVPPDLAAIGNYLEPIKQWLSIHSKPGDCTLIQGDFGATYIMVDFAFKLGLIPVYATTQREAIEQIQADGSIQLTHRFFHKRLRKYGG